MRKRQFELVDRPIAFQRSFVRLTGSVNAALMLSQAVYWSDRTSDAQGWFYKSQKEWEEETGLSRSEQEIARKQLKAKGFWEEKLKGMPATLYFRVDCEILQSCLQKTCILVCENLHTSLQVQTKLENSKLLENQQHSRQEIPSEITSETTTEIAPAAPIDLSNLNQLINDWHARRWKTDEDGRRYLVTPASPHRKVYESEVPK